MLILELSVKHCSPTPLELACSAIYSRGICWKLVPRITCLSISCFLPSQYGSSSLAPSLLPEYDFVSLPLFTTTCYLTLITKREGSSLSSSPALSFFPSSLLHFTPNPNLFGNLGHSLPSIYSTLLLYLLFFPRKPVLSLSSLPQLLASTSRFPQVASSSPIIFTPYFTNCNCVIIVCA